MFGEIRGVCLCRVKHFTLFLSDAVSLSDTVLTEWENQLELHNIFSPFSRGGKAQGKGRVCVCLGLCVCLLF